MGAFVISPRPPLLTQTSCAARPLRSTGVTPLPRYYGPGRRRLAFGRLPGCAGYTAYLAPPISRWDEDGFSSCSACPCHRAAPNHPAGVTCRVSQSAPCHVAFAPKQRARPPDSIFSRPPLGSLSLRPGDLLAIPRMALSVGFIRFVSSTDATQATGLPTFAPVGLTPTEHASLCWTHCSAKTSSNSSNWMV